ncbi:peptidase M14 [Lottiidibacillus patelloidae]|uniref:Peptidase M14 n=1 Tax=Lottiidibacillus patelloidae TaxID=2670334 RepID=A0A263BVF4_9BACI|nr:M14 family metallopeptidase [Lottiidibacillus patelloidae]OZM57675.1 peptidase M14 [Lottiidibacillus patelloidae]
MFVSAYSGSDFEYYSKIFEVPEEIIAASNGNINMWFPQANKIKIPGYMPAYYQTKHNDTLHSIAAKYRININALCIVNRIFSSKYLYPGQIIIIPRKIKKLIVDPDEPISYEKLMHYLMQLTYLYPFLFTRNLGKSVLGKDIPEVIVGTGRKRVHINASFHANEWITTNVLIYFLNEYALALANNEEISGRSALSLFKETQLSITPMVNPDGVNLVLFGAQAAGPFSSYVQQLNKGKNSYKDWKANIRGVDLNNQFPADWHLEVPRKPQVPAPRDFPGYFPLSEPEALVMANVTAHSNFDRVVALHTQGKEFYWGYKGLEPPESKKLAAEFSRVSGYKSVQMIDSYAGYKDWFIQVWRKPGFTIELGEGVNPLPLSQFDEIYEDTKGILAASLYM